MTRTPELIRGEMRLWSDLAADAMRPAPRGRVLAALLTQALGDVADLLVVGPHDPDLLTGLVAPGRRITVVLRSVTDAEAVQSALPEARVVCGGLDALDSGSYDAVVALDGAERVLSNDSPEASWRARLDLVRSFVADGGRLVCSVDNPRSLLALADARPLVERRDTGDWEPPAETDPTRPQTLAVASEILGGTAYSCWPLVTAPTAILAAAGTSAADLRIRAALADSSGALAGRDLLFDPGSELERAIAADVVDSAVPGWIFVVGAQVAADAIFEDHPSRAHSLVRVLAGGSCNSVGSPAPVAPVAPVVTDPLPQGHADEDAPAVVGSTAPAGFSRNDPSDHAVGGELLIDRLRLLSLTEDLPELRAVVGDYLSWVRQLAEPERAAFATPGNVTGQDDALAVLDDSYALTDVPDADVALGRIALDTARVLLDLRLRRIWPPWIGVPELARALAAMAEIELDEAVWAEAARLDEALAHTRTTVLDEDVRSLRTLADELRRELWSVRGQVFAHERITDLRDKQLERLSNQVHELKRRTAEAEMGIDHDTRHLVSIRRDSTAYKAARAMRHPGMAVRWVRDRRKR